MANLAPIPVEHATSGSTRWARLLQVNGKGHAIAILFLIVWMALCGIYLASADTPWESSIERRLEDGKRLNDDHVQTIAFWWGAVVNISGALLLLAIAPLWAKQIPATSESWNRRQAPVEWVVTLGLLLLVAVAAGVLRAPRMSHGFTNDEEMAWRNNGVGYWKPDPEGGKPEFKDVSWTRTILTNRALNNHTLQSIVSRASNRIWQKWNDRAPSEFSEMAIRAPILLAGIGSITLIGVLGTIIGNVRAGIGAALMLALSPWHMRYAAEGRGYSLMILLMLAALIVSIIAIERRQLRWWVLFGIFQAGYIYAFPGSFYVAPLHCSLLFATLLFLPLKDKRVDVARLLAGGMLSVMLYLGTQFYASGQLFGSVSQTLGKRDPIGLGWVLDVVSHLVAGIPWHSTPQAFHNGMSVKFGWDGQPFYVWVVVVVFPMIAVVGFGHLMLTGWRQRIAVFPVLAGACLAIGHSLATGSTLFGWYVVYLVIPFALCVSWAADRVAPAKSRQFAWFLLLTLGLYVMTVAEPLHRIGNFERQPMQKVAEAARGRTHPVIPPVEGDRITATFGTSARQILSYDPLVRIPDNLADLENLMKEAREEKKKLIVYFCDPLRAEREWPDLYQRIVKSDDFEQKEVFKGLEAMFRYVIYEWLP
ncbi:MAG: hypothetical protein ACI9R3_005125 [Verrucomicrobiales bacterium]|jgi:hypothetical protein